MAWTTKFSVNFTSIWQAAQIIILLTCMGTNSGCYYYKSVVYAHDATRQKKFCRHLHSSLNTDKYVIVHQGNNTWHLSNMFINLPDRKNCTPNYTVLYGNLEEVDSVCAVYYNKYRERHQRAVRYFIEDEDYVISQVHVYLGENGFRLNDSISIPVSSIQRIEVYNQATGRTFWTWGSLNILTDILFSHGSTSKQEPTKKAPNVQHGPRRR